MNYLSKDTIIAALIDCFGYSEIDFQDMNRNEIIESLTDEEIATVKSYNGVKE